LVLDPRNSNAYNNRGIAYRHKGLYDQAIDDYTKAIDLKPKFEIPYNNRGIAYRNKGLYDQAIADYSKAIELNPRNANAYTHRGNAYYDKRLYALAEIDYSKAIELDPGYEYLYLRLLNAAWMRKGEVAGALERLRQYEASVVSIGPLRAVSLYYLGSGSKNDRYILATIASTKDEKRHSEMLCEACFFLGVKRFADDDRLGAKDYFSRSIETKAVDCDEYYSSKAMLQRMN
jgi:tetratricopeptide (TPR) repeat protein